MIEQRTPSVIDRPQITVHDGLFKVESDWLTDLCDALEYAEAMGMTITDGLDF